MTTQDLLSQLVAIPSVSSQDNTPVIELISQWFDTYEKETQEWARQDGVKGKNLIVKIPGKTSERSLVFVCHMDTVPTSSEWKTDPFELIEKDGKLYGLGSCDTKGGTASLIKAVLTLEEKPTCDTFLVFSGDEEATSAGVDKLKEKSVFTQAEFIFIEPTDNKVLVSQRALLQVDVITHGLSQHGSYATPEENKKSNAIFKMAQALPLLIQDAEEIAKDTDTFLGSNTQNFGTIKGGTARNVFPDTCLLEVDRRILPQRNPEEELQRITTLLQEQDASTEVIKNIIHPGFLTSKDAHVVQISLKAMEDNGRHDGVGGFQAWSEAGLYAGVGDVIILGPGSISQAHKANEFLEKKDLEDFVPIFQQLILGV